jgi:hypothetical protein
MRCVLGSAGEIPFQVVSAHLPSKCIRWG